MNKVSINISITICKTLHINNLNYYIKYSWHYIQTIQLFIQTYKPPKGQVKTHTPSFPVTSSSLLVLMARQRGPGTSNLWRRSPDVLKMATRWFSKSAMRTSPSGVMRMSRGPPTSPLRSSLLYCPLTEKTCTLLLKSVMNSSLL